jgi:hypothetical protein
MALPAVHHSPLSLALLLDWRVRKLHHTITQPIGVVGLRRACDTIKNGEDLNFWAGRD